MAQSKSIVSELYNDIAQQLNGVMNAGLGNYGLSHDCWMQLLGQTTMQQQFQQPTFNPAYLPAPAKPDVKPTSDEFSWLRRRVDEVCWRAASPAAE